jgi:hypothetical protein
MVCAAVLLTSCGRPYALDCGPLVMQACEERAAAIVSGVSSAFAGRRVASIVILNIEGDARVILNDGTEVGFGRRH